MLHRIIGAAGSGKTEYLLDRIGEAIKKRRRCFLIVPEQMSVDYEGLMCDRFGDGSNLYCETLNFERLPNRVAREYGGLAANNIDKGGACALLSLTAESLSERLDEFSSVASDGDFASSLFALSARMKMAMVTPEQLRAAANDPSVSESPSLARKIGEISLILEEYEKNFGAGLLDPRDALTRLAAELPEKPFFKGAYVFIDGYYNFTAQELAVIKQLAAQSEEVFVTFTVDGDRPFFELNAKAADAVKRLSPGGCEDHYTGGMKRAEKRSIAHVSANIWSSGAPKFSEDDGGIALINSSNRFDECESAAAEIISFIRRGNRWRDVAVLAGSADKYRGIVDQVFLRAGIPCYMSRSEDITSKPLVAFLLASLAVVAENFSFRSVKRYIKTGFTDLTVNESDVLIDYAGSWDLRGKAWYGDEEWTLDPEGFREGDLTKRGAAMLRIANRARAKLVPPLAALRETLSAKQFTVASGVRALYDHLIACGADEKLRAEAQRALRRGDKEASDRAVQVWKLLVNVLDQLYKTCGERLVTVKRLQSLIKLTCENYSLGAIPASADSVMFGDASLVRAGGRKMVVLLGMCDGEFPASGSSGVFFDREEASLLENAGIDLADTLERSMNSGRFLVYAALSAPTERLVLCFPQGELTGDQLRRSPAYLSVAAMLPAVAERFFDPAAEFYSADRVASAYPELEKGALRDKIGAALTGKGVGFFDSPPASCDRLSRIDFVGDSLNLSPSRFERYALCPFSFFGSYLLGLKEKKKNDWATPEIGNFIHNILEKFMRSCVREGSFDVPGEEERKARVRELSKKYFLDVIGEEYSSNKRFTHTYENMIRTLDLVTADLCAEFAESRFVPAGFEFGIGTGNNDMPAVSYDRDGKRVTLRGSIDRVDVYVRNGVTYVRVVDYKTYKKTFSADLVACGLDTQMLHYLFAYCADRNAVPAGVLYYTVRLPSVELEGELSDDEIRERAGRALTREGILLNDPDIVFAMSESCRFVPVTVKKDGTLGDRAGRLKSPEEFNELCQLITNGVYDMSGKIFSGVMDVAPLDGVKGADPCKYCRMSALCRASRRKEELPDETD